MDRLHLEVSFRFPVIFTHQHFVTFSLSYCQNLISRQPRDGLCSKTHSRILVGPYFFPSHRHLFHKKRRRDIRQKDKFTTMAEPPPPPRLPDCPPHEVTHDEVNIAQAAPPSPVRTNKAPVANLFGVSQGVTQNKRSSIPRVKTGHTPVRKIHGDATQRASSVRARVAIQEALSAEMSTLQVDDSLSGRIELSDHCQTTEMTTTTNASMTRLTTRIMIPRRLPTPPPNHGLRRFEIKNSKPKLIINRNFMCFL